MKKQWKFGLSLLVALVAVLLGLGLHTSAATPPTDSNWPSNATDPNNENVYYIYDEADLKAFADQMANQGYYAGKTIRLANDITYNTGDASTWGTTAPTYAWPSIGTAAATAFQGVFDGQGHSISGIYILRSGDNCGFFGYLANDAVVKNLTLKNGYFTSNGTSLGALAASSYGATVSHVIVDSDVYIVSTATADKYNVGGLIGQMHAPDKNANNKGTVGQTIIEYSEFRGTITTTAKLQIVGGITGRSMYGNDTYPDEIRYCKVSGTINSKSTKTGGIIGCTQGAKVNVTGCVFSGSITNSNTFTGGIAGAVTGNYALTIDKSLVTGTIATTNNYTGGMVGENTQGNATITNCLVIADIGCTEGGGGGGQTGVFIGRIYKGTVSFTNCYASKEHVFRDTDGNNSGPGQVSTMYGTVTASTGVYSGTNVSIVAKDASLYGYSAYTNAPQLDYSNDWTLVRGSVPYVREIADLPLDVSWYDASKTTYSIGTKEQLNGFSFLAETLNFADKTILLTDDIDMNPGWDASTGTKPETPWTPIPVNGVGKNFAGTFNGQGHTISGLYTNGGTGASVAMFGVISSSGVVKNFRLTNSYFESKGSRLGSIAGTLQGKISQVYSDAYVVNSATNTPAAVGGIAGGVSTTAAEISETWFNGSVTTPNGTPNRVGGILGGLEGGGVDKVTVISDCLFTGTVDCKATGGAGGILGAAFSASVSIQNCLSLGSVKTTAAGNEGSILGILFATYKGTINNCYGIGGSKGFLIGTCQQGAILNGKTLSSDAAKVTNGHGVQIIEKAWVEGAKAYGIMGFDFNEKWITVTDGAPIPKALKTGETEADTSSLYGGNIQWYKNGNVLKTMSDFVGFVNLSKYVNFYNQTILLDTDITWNQGKAEDFKTEAPAYPFPMIGDISTAIFNGVFDGQNHTISGIYIKNLTEKTGLFAAININATVKNFALTNSYIASNSNFLGSVAGSLQGGRIENVYSDAIVHELANGADIGGITGSISCKTQSGSVDSVWFNGTIIATDKVGDKAPNYAGGIVGASTGDGTVTHSIKNALFTGTISASAVTGGVGGILGYAMNQHISIEGAIADGNITSGNANNWGAIVGRSASGWTVTLTNCYGVSDSAPRTLGLIEGSVVGTAPLLLRSNITGVSAYANTTIDYRTTWMLRNGELPIPRKLTSLNLLANEPEAVVMVRTLSRLKQGTNDSFAPLTGGGYYNVFETFTVTAKEKPGYTMTGWFLSKNGGKTILVNPLSEALSYQDIAATLGSDEVTLVAIYDFGSVNTIPVKISGSDIMVSVNGSDPNSYTETYSENLMAGTEVTVTYTGAGEFYAWVNRSGRVLSREESYTFTVYTEMEVFAQEGGIDESRVTFLSEYNQVLISESYASGETITFPSVAGTLGKSFLGYSVNQSDAMDEESARTEISNLIESGVKLITVSMRYEVSQDVYHVDIQSRYVADIYDLSTYEDIDLIATDDVSVAGIVKVSTETEKNGHTFCFYVDGNGIIISYSPEFRYRSAETVTLYAIYSDEVPESEPEIHITVGEIKEQGNGKYTFIFSATRTLPEGCTIVEQGLLIMPGNGLSETAYSDAVKHLFKGDTSVGSYISSGVDANDVTTVNVKNVTDALSVFVKGYMIIKDNKNQQHIYYSEIAYGDTTHGITIER